jgi:hypothetical protein
MRSALQIARRPENVFLWLLFGAWAIQAFVMEYYEFERWPKNSETVTTSILSMAMAYWVMRDSERRGMPRPFILGFFMVAGAWPFIGLWHLFNTRGRRAFITLGIFVIVLLLTFVVPAWVATFAR